MEPFVITKPVTLTLEPQELALVLDALAEMPIKRAQGTFNKIVEQIRALEVPLQAA